ncbi:MarR family transcriptional regulator [Rhodobacteraceae bacterium F11138]|nr:MarR family transcriptional regulator [Rhodobacteraceae bacterium F11138]
MKLETHFPYQLAVVAEAFSRNLTQVYGRDFGLGREEWRLLLLLADEDAVTSPELARRTTLDKVQVTRASQRLEEKGLITRKVDDNDRRLRIYRCTRKGRALFAKVQPAVEKRAKRILDEMAPTDVDALVQGLEALQSAMTRIKQGNDRNAG